jgi:hypothetical protein
MPKEDEDKEEKNDIDAGVALESKVKDKMNEIFSPEANDDEDLSEDDNSDDEVDDDDDDDVGHTSTDKTDSEEDEDVDDEVDNTDEATSKSGKKTDDDETLTLPAAHIQTALRLGMSEDEVKEQFDENPKFMISALAKLHAGENNLSARYSQMGRAIQEKELGKAKSKSDDKSTPDSFVDIEKLKERFDEDDDEATALIDGVIKPLNDALVEMKAQLGTRGQPTGHAEYNQQEERAIQSEVNNFFDNDNMKEFRDYYGTVKPGEDPRVVLTGAQFRHRGQVCAEGNLIRIGADFSGDKLTITDVLQRAHLQLTEPMREEMIREQISSKIKKRSKGLSIKAGVKKTSKAPTEKDPTKRLEAKTKERLKKVFG